MSGEHISNNSVETQNYEGELRSYKNQKKRVDINTLLNKVRENQKKKNLSLQFSLV